MNVAFALASVLAAAAALGRWLRVAQREHYLPGSVFRFTVRWWRRWPVDAPLAALILTTAAVSLRPGLEGFGWVALVGVAVGPTRLSIRGVTSPLAWTPRMRRLAAVAAVPVVTAAVTSIVAGSVAPATWGAVLVPVWVEGALALTAPLERRLGSTWVRRAAARLADADVSVVAITGSFGKTTTKAYVAHLLSGRRSVVASPASFNNRMGLARAVNEHLGPGADVFVAEMGTYGPGEIAELCDWIPPDVAVITAIGPVHLERMGTEEAIVAAKREILTRAPVAVLCVDHPLLAAVAEEERARRRVITCSAVGDADVVVSPDGRVHVGGRVVGATDRTGRADRSNLAAAVGAVLGLGLDPDEVADRFTDLPVVPHRRTRGTSPRGFVVIDDTYNANPAGAAAALADLVDAAPRGRRVVVTPGMVELGSRQEEENRRFAAAVAGAGAELIVVGETNRRALVDGAKEAGGTVIVLPDRAAAVEWVRDRLGPGDAVLYENDLPDHYP